MSADQLDTLVKENEIETPIEWTSWDAKGKRQWSQIANKLLSKGKPEGQAIREANGVAKRMYGKR